MYDRYVWYMYIVQWVKEHVKHISIIVSPVKALTYMFGMCCVKQGARYTRVKHIPVFLNTKTLKSVKGWQKL
jgi:hypothetical protein